MRTRTRAQAQGVLDRSAAKEARRRICSHHVAHAIDEAEDSPNELGWEVGQNSGHLADDAAAFADSVETPARLRKRVRIMIKLFQQFHQLPAKYRTAWVRTLDLQI